MFDKNTLRVNGREVFVPAISHWKQQNCAHITGAQEDEIQQSAVQVYVRKRPMFEKEYNADYDVCTVLPGRPVSTQMVMHNCLYQADLKTPFINHLTFDFDHVWDSDADSSDVYRCAAAPLVRSALDGGVSTMFMFGQTGSGKTFTMSAIQEMAAQDLFKGSGGDEPWVAVQFVELRGNRCFDLLAPSCADPRKKQFGDMRPELKLREHADGAYMADGAADAFPKTAEELVNIFEMAQSRRATSSTEANDVSSRSHAVCTLRLFQSEGQLMLVDCAGTERRKDSMFHSKERQQEGAEINASLHALKECIRLLITQHRVPSHAYRASSLTKILADAFIRGSEAKLAVICTASPCATDTEHTVGTLRMGMALAGRGNEQEDKMMLNDFLQARKKPRLAHPKQWAPEQVFEWFATVGGGQFVDVLDALPETFTGQMLVRLTESRCVQLCGDQRRGRRLFDLLHHEIQITEASRKGSH
jgi:kinesin family protein 2/24